MNNGRLRNFKRQTYTVIRYAGLDIVTQKPQYRYLRGEGLITPSTSVQTVQTGDVRFDITYEILVYTKQTYPRLDITGIGSQPPDWLGDDYDPDFVVWHGVTFKPYGISQYAKVGKNDYRKVVCLYDSGGAVGNPKPRDLLWYEIEDFQEAVNTTEMALEMVLAKIECQPN